MQSDPLDPPLSRSHQIVTGAAWIAERIAALRGWRRLLLAMAAGAISVLAMAPFFLWPLLFVTLPVLVWLIEGARHFALRVMLGMHSHDAASQPHAHKEPASTSLAHRAAALVGPASIGWAFAFGFHVPGLYWLREAFAVTAGTLELLWPLAVLGLPAYLALFHGLAAAVAAMTPGTVLHRTLALALALTASEWLRGHVFTGFPWNVLGYALTFPLVLLQSASILGIYGLTLLTVLICAGPGVLLATRATATSATRPTAGRTITDAVLLALLPLGLMTAFGAWRLSHPAPAFVEGVRLRLVQPAIPQRAKWQAERQREFFDRHIALTGTNSAGQPDDLAGITHVIWPEAAMPFQPLRYPNILADIGEALPPGVHLLAGLLRSEPDPTAGPDPSSGASDAHSASAPPRAFNSVGVFDHTGKPTTIYDKIHLVPFGEYLPFQRTLESIGLESLTRQRGGFAIGAHPRPLLTIPGMPPVGILICYEAVFPAAVVQGRERPGLLLNITNDGWFGNSTGPRQHLQQARVRGVEEGVALMRIANNGISAVFDAYGRELARLDLDIPGVIDTGVPGALPPPAYARFGDWLTFWLCAGLLLGLWRATTRRK